MNSMTDEQRQRVREFMPANAVPGAAVGLVRDGEPAACERFDLADVGTGRAH